MNKIIEKMKVACKSGAVTALVCMAQPAPSFASDIELYRAPQERDMTLMFMLDMSGSMDNKDGTSTSRIQKLRNAMNKLLKGDSVNGINPLPDKLVTGLSTFNTDKGIIKLEAMSLGSAIPLDGVRELYKTTQDTSQPATRTQTRQKTDEFWKEINQTQTRNCGLFNCNNANWSAWSPSETSAATSWTTKNNPGSYGSATTSSPTLTGSVTPTGSVIAQECTEWNTDNTTCKTWAATTKQASDFVNATPTSSPTTPSYGSWSNSGAPTTVPTSIVGPLGLEPGSGNLSNCNLFGNLCEKNSRIVKKERITTTITETQVQTTTVSFTTTTVYKGTAYQTHRQRMINEVSKLQANDSTPTGYAYAEVAAYLMGQTTTGEIGSGFNNSTVGSTTTVNGVVKKIGIRDNNNYFNPPSVDGTKTCNSQGIYFLTDGQPQYYYNNNKTTLESLMKKSLGSKASSFSCSNASTLGLRSTGYSNNSTMAAPNGWDCIGAYTKALLEPTLNPAGASIETAVVGFGNDFSSGTGSDVLDAQDWGTLGRGGWYAGNSEKQIVDSVIAFMNKMDKYIPSVTVGSATIPVDALDTQNVQPWAYFPQFDPQPSNTTTGVITWFGNVKKYKTLNNSLVDRSGSSIISNTSDGKVSGLLKDNINDYWADTDIKKNITKLVNGVKTDDIVNVGGALSQLVLGYNAATPAERRIFTDRKYIVDPNDSTKNKVDLVTSGQDLKKIGRADFLSTSTNQFKEDPKRAYLLSLYGYKISKDLAVNLSLNPKDSGYQTSLEQSLNETPARDWLMGAVMHSRPVLLTQEGKTKYENDVLTYDNRDDLILYGTTQGVLHVVKAGKDANDTTTAGKELFAFVPNEMIENQAEGFLSQASQSGTLKYGIDGQWTAYTEYVTKKGSAATDEPVVTVKGGKQWVYGGLRMGGKSYYALDLTDVSSTDNSSVPKIKFRIDPASATSGPLSYMGQSWSKPTIATVNWKGSRKLVMFVGGGYDMGYEADDYNQTNGVGAGVYMFDADNGNLLWWASSNATNANGSATEQAKNVTDMSYSVVSQIKTVDRNNDGLVDHLYFGDLGGQLWRTDLNNGLSSDSTGAFATHAIKLLDLHASNGGSPRFYTTPSFTIHSGGTSGLFAAVTIGSGDLSSPMSAAGANGKDAIYVIYDKDVTKANLYQLTDANLVSKNIQKGTTGNTLASNADGKTKTDLTRGGWYYPLNSKFRVLNDTVAIDSDLYVSIFDANQDIAASCEGGVRGQSDVHQFCLPYGQCTETVAGNTTVKDHAASIFLGKGNIGIAFGGITGNSSRDRSLVLNVPKPTGQNLPNYSGKLKFVSQRWYEKYAKAS